MPHSGNTQAPTGRFLCRTNTAESMMYYLQLSPQHNDPIFRLQTDHTWRRVEHLEPLQDGDYSTADPEDIIALQHVDTKLTIDEKVWNVEPTQGSALEGMMALWYTAYLSRSGSVPVPKLEQLLETISGGDDRRGNRLVMNVNGSFELRSFDADERTYKDPSVVIRHESFQARGGYVGKKAGKDVRYYLPWFTDSLDAWVHHLSLCQCNVYSGTHTEAKLEDIEMQLGIPSNRPPAQESPLPLVRAIAEREEPSPDVALDPPVSVTPLTRPNKRRRSRATRVGPWKLTDPLGSGGNGEVWTCENDGGEVRAIKLLKKITPKRYARFSAEVKVMEANADIPGILPILDKFLPDGPSGCTPYYVMPVARTMERSSSGKSLEQKVDIILEICECVSQLHKREIIHRDIKPPNILYLKEHYYLADFGLADFPEKERLSDPNEEIGAKWTIAPEMRRESESADAKKGDVYSLAKTLWILLTGHRKGFDGQYTVDSIIELKRFHRDSYTEPIDGLLARCTDIDPKKRPSVDELIQDLVDWKTLVRDFHSQNRRQWLTLQNKLFPGSLPQRASWERLEDIMHVLQAVSGEKNLNHLFFPTGGGLDLHGVKLSHELGCLELDLVRPHIVKPKRLVFESFASDPEWNYFYLELDTLARATVTDDDGQGLFKDNDEELSELSPLAYYPFAVLNDRDKYEHKYFIAEEARHIRRWLKGSMVVFCKRSTYNLSTDTYDGRHNKMTVEEFRAYIAANVRRADEMRAAQQAAVENLSTPTLPTGPPKDHRIREIPIFRCGHCGNIVSEDGAELEPESREYHIKVYETYGGSLTTCDSCHARLVAESRIEAEKAEPSSQSPSQQ